MKRTALFSLLLASSLVAAPQALHNDTKTGVVAETPIKFTLNQLYLNGTLLEAQLSLLGLPTQTSNGGKFLTTNGTTASWSHDTATGIGATTVGSNIFSFTNPSAITFLQINANNTVSALSASAFRTAIGAGTSSFSGAFVDLSGKPTTLSGYGITDAQPLDSDLTAIAALSTTSFGRGLLPLTDAAAVRTYIGAGAASFDGVFSSLSGIPTTIAGYGITDAQPLDSDLTSIAALSTTSFGRGFLPLANAGAARTYIGAGTSNFDGAFSSLSGIPSNVTNAIAAISTANTVYVMPATSGGNDSTGLRERFDKPFATLSAAHTAMSAGDTIVWNAGAYTPGAGATTISKNNITILAYGAVLNASSGTDYTKLIISGNGVKVYGLEGDGKYTSGSDPNSGFIQVSGSDVELHGLYLHDHAGRLIRTLAGSNRLWIDGCHLVNGYKGIATTNYASSGTVVGMRFTNNTIENCRYDAIAHYPEGWTGTSNAISGTIISTNTLRGNTRGIEAFNGFMDGLIIGPNNINGGLYAVSVAPATNTSVFNNTCKGQTYCAIEFANLTANCGNVASDNNIDLLDDSGTYNGATGYNVTSSVTGSTGLVISGGSIWNTGVGGGGTSGGAVRVLGTDNVRVTELHTYGVGAPFVVSYSNKVTVENNICDILIDTAYGISTEAASATTLTGFYYKNNRFNRIGYTSGYAPYHFYSPAANATFNDVKIEETRTNQTTAASGFVDTSTNTVNSILRNNQPQSTNGSFTTGFFNTIEATTGNTYGTFTANGIVTSSGPDEPLSVKSTAGHMGMIVDATKAGGTGQANVWFAKNGSLNFQFGHDFNANGTKDFFIYDGTRSALDVYCSLGGGVNIGHNTFNTSAGNLLVNGLTPSSFVKTNSSKVLISETPAQIRTDLALDTSAGLAAALSDEVGYSTGAKAMFNHGPPIYDNAGTPKLSADFNNRVLYSTDGATEIIDWNGPSVSIGSITIGADGTSDLIAGAVGDLVHQFGYGLDVTANSFAPGSDLKISSQDDSNYFDNSGFHGVLVGTIGTPAAKPGGAIFAHYTDVSTTHTNGTEDDLYSDTLVASTLGANGDNIYEVEHVTFVSSATAARRLKKYFGGTLVFDSGSLTLTLGGDFTLQTTIIRESSSIVRCDVAVTSTSASTVPYSTYTRITGLTLSNTQVLKTTGIASGTGAASGDVVDKLAKITWSPAP